MPPSVNPDVYRRVQDCPACNQSHFGVLFRPLRETERQGKFAYAGKCPATNVNIYWLRENR